MVVTGRARMVAAIAIFAFFFGVIGQRWLIGVTGPAILLWFGYEWVVFRYRLDVAMKSFEVERNVSDRRGVARSLWELQTYEVETVVRVVPGFGMTHLEITDQVPQTTKLVTDLDDSASALTNVQEIKVQYRIMANRVGRVFFPGVQVQLNDLHGLFSLSAAPVDSAFPARHQCDLRQYTAGQR